MKLTFRSVLSCLLLCGTTLLAEQMSGLSPAASQQKIQLDGPYEVQLVAAEPLVIDPVEIAWDARGRMFVAELRDYPLGPAGAGDAWLSRIVELQDPNQDGRMDAVVVFADHLDHVQGLLAFRDGLIATTRTEILFLKDTDGDGHADVREPLIKGFAPQHSQLQVSAPRQGPDGRVYFNNGLEAKEVYAVAEEKLAVNVARSDLRWDPATGKLERTTGYGQYGGAFDDYGNRFVCSNRNPVMFAVMPYAAVVRNPHAGIAEGWEDIAPAGSATRVYPLGITHTTSDAHAGTNTACCGLGVYRGDVMPELRNNVFVCDPTGQLITRYKISPQGASLKATRVGVRTEFFRSADEWCRPVNFATGPDGAIYVCDMYRRYIEHARYFPESFVKAHNLREGDQQGRIWRIVPQGYQARPRAVPVPAPAVPDEARKLFLRLLETTDPAVQAAAIEAHPEDPWITKAALSASANSAGAALRQLLSTGKFRDTYSPTKAETLRSLARAAAADSVETDFHQALEPLLKHASDSPWWVPPMLHGLAEGLPTAKGKLGAHSLAELLQHPPAALTNMAAKLNVLMQRVEATLANSSTTESARLAALPLLAQRPWEQAQPIVREILTSAKPAPALINAALALLAKFPATQTSGLIYELLPQAGPRVKQALVPRLTSDPKLALEFFQRIEQGEFSVALVDIETRWGLQQGTGPLRELAVKLFGQPSADRAAVITAYLETTQGGGDAQRGREIFATACIACHQLGELGVAVGPYLADVKVKAPEALLSDILDPNRVVEARWCHYEITRQDDTILGGLITSETPDALVLTLMGGGTQTIPRSEIKTVRSLDRSLMPVGLEAAISKAQMRDLLAFLLKP